MDKQNVAAAEELPYCHHCANFGHRSDECWASPLRLTTPQPVPSSEPAADLRAPALLPESMSRDKMLKYYSDYANVQASEALQYQKRIRDLEMALATLPAVESKPIAKIHSDGYWTRMNDWKEPVNFASVEVYATPVAAAPMSTDDAELIIKKLNECIAGSQRGWGWIDLVRAVERHHGIAAPAAATPVAAAEPLGDDELVPVPRKLLAAAVGAIRAKHDAPKTVEAIRALYWQKAVAAEPSDAWVKAVSVLEDVRGNINPERGYAEELEADIEAAILALRQGTAAPASVPAGSEAGRKQGGA